jgi:hypothetical protein
VINNGILIIAAGNGIEQTGIYDMQNRLCFCFNFTFSKIFTKKPVSKKETGLDQIELRTSFNNYHFFDIGK